MARQRDHLRETMPNTNDRPARDDETRDDDEAADDPRKPYRAPSLMKMGSVARLTLLSGGGTTGVGVVSTLD